MENSGLNLQIESFLSEIGTCWRCILIFLGETKVEVFNASISSKDNQEEIGNEPVDDACQTDQKVQDPALGEMENGSPSSPKRLKMFVCVSCLGLLQYCKSSSTISQLCNVINDGGYDADEIALALSIPVCMIIRIHAIWAHLVQKFPTYEVNTSRLTHIGVLKDIWRTLAGAEIAASLNKKVISGQSTFLNLVVIASYASDFKECLKIEKLDPKTFKTRRKQHRKFAEGLFTKQVVDDTLTATPDERFLELCPDVPSIPTERVSYTNSKCSHTSIYFAGRYNKYSRELSQTPWFVDGERRLESSVQELICDPLNLEVKADGLKFSASGREDVDVRCLGRGRPFVVEFLNPRRTKFTPEQFRSFQKEVNSSTDIVRIRDLQLVTKKDTSTLKEGEEEKTKAYCALCICKAGITDEMLEKINSISELTLNQTTPIRVLHRRNLSVRKRVVHSARAERIDEHFFKVYMNTQAGTYIKEFVHGDFGRTTPNLGIIVGSPCDILALDVEDIHLDWPQYLEEKDS